MAFRDFPDYQQGVELLQRSLERGRLAHAYLFTGDRLSELESLAGSLAQTLNCQNPVRRGGVAVDSCGQCAACRKIEHGNHADVHWVRPESKSRIIPVEQMRDLIREINLRPTEARYKVAVVVAADRLKTEGANAFLKTLEEPPSNSVLVLLTTEPQRLLETIVSRCLRLSFGVGGAGRLEPGLVEWLKTFSEVAAGEQKSLIGRYRLADILVGKLTKMRGGIEETLTARSPMQQYSDAEPEQIERWEDELKAAIEAEYRRQRGDVLGALQWWLRDVWLRTMRLDSRAESGGDLLTFPEMGGTETVARRLSPREAGENLRIIDQLQRWLFTNVQEALALEVSLLKLKL